MYSLVPDNNPLRHPARRVKKQFRSLTSEENTNIIIQWWKKSASCGLKQTKIASQLNRTWKS